MDLLTMMATMNLAVQIGPLIDSFKINGRCNLDFYSIAIALSSLFMCSTQSHLFLNFFSYIADITPPTLTFRRRPFYSNANITIEWSYDEEASSHCTLQTPTLLLPVNCNQSVTLQNLAEGLHSLFIQGTDLAGNSVTVRHTWSVGM